MTDPKQLKHKDLFVLRNDLHEKQKGVCPICDRLIDISNAVVDHHHKKRVKGSGLIRGVLCRNCNVFLGKIENNCVRYNISQNALPAVLSNIISYLIKPHLPFLHPSERPKLKKESYQALKKAMKKDGKKIPPYPKQKALTKPLEKLFKQYKIEPKED
jgi:hypothetical protein